MKYIFFKVPKKLDYYGTATTYEGEWNEIHIPMNFSFNDYHYYASSEYYYNLYYLNVKQSVEISKEEFTSHKTLSEEIKIIL